MTFFARARRKEYTHIHDAKGEPVVLGEGQFGVVYKVKRGDKICALKELKTNDRHAKQEIELLKSVKHDNIIEYHASYEKTGRLLILMEYANVGTLTLCVNYFKDSEEWRRGPGAEFNVWRFLAQMADAFVYLHSKRIMHRDLKPDNILGVRSQGVLAWKVADFGVAKLIDSATMQSYYEHTIAGTLSYMAPEILKGDKYDYATDVWSLGAILSFYGHMGKHWRTFPIQESTEDKQPLPSFYSRDLRGLIGQMLLSNPNNRPTMKKIDEECQKDNRQSERETTTATATRSRSHDDEDDVEELSGLHPGIFCDGCSGAVDGNRFVCRTCEDYDLCWNCFKRNRHRHHDMIVLRPPDSKKTEIARKMALLMLLKEISSEIDDD